MTHEHHIWHVDKVEALIANQGRGTDRLLRRFHYDKFINLFDGVFVLEVNLGTLLSA